MTTLELYATQCLHERVLRAAWGNVGIQVGNHRPNRIQPLIAMLRLIEVNELCDAIDDGDPHYLPVGAS